MSVKNKNEQNCLLGNCKNCDHKPTISFLCLLKNRKKSDTHYSTLAAYYFSQNFGCFGDFQVRTLVFEVGMGSNIRIYSNIKMLKYSIFEPGKLFEYQNRISGQNKTPLAIRNV
jgi:hypothetical protein